MILEGAIFDRSGNLLFCDVSGRRVLLTPDKQLSTVDTLDALLAGRLVLPPGRTPCSSRRWTFRWPRRDQLAVNPDGSGLQAVIPPVAGYMPNDLVFDARGGFYFTDFKGNATEPKGACTTRHRT